MNSWWLPLVHRRVWTVLSIALVALVIYGSLAPGGVKAMEPIGDKWQHAASYFMLAAWFTGLARRHAYPWIASGLLLLGLSLELLQHALTVRRVADARDMAADAAGVAAGIVVAQIWLGAWALRVEAWLTRDA